jgi:hypothetical protein
MPKIKDLNQYLTDKTGLSKEERQLWRDKISELLEKGDREEAMRCFQSFSYWKQKYSKSLPVS